MGKDVYKPEAPINQTVKNLRERYANQGGAYKTEAERAKSASYNASVNPAYVAGSPTSAVRDFADQSAWDAKYGNNNGTAVDDPNAIGYNGMSQNQAIAKALKDAENYTAGVYTGGRTSSGGATPSADERVGGSSDVATMPVTPATTTQTHTNTSNKYTPDELAWLKTQYAKGKGTGNQMVGADDPGALVTTTWGELNDIAAANGWGGTTAAGGGGTTTATGGGTTAAGGGTTTATGGGTTAATGGGTTTGAGGGTGVPPTPGSAEWENYLASVNPAFIRSVPGWTSPYGTAAAAAGRAGPQSVGKMPDGTPIPPRPVAFSPMTPEEQASIAQWDAKYAKYV